jgi:uncharacterized cupin superfamily protein
MSTGERLNFLADEPWDETKDQEKIRIRWFGRAFGTQALGASLTELGPRSPEAMFPLHMHYGSEEMFFILSGRPTFRTSAGDTQLEPGTVVYCPEGVDGLHTLMNLTDEPARFIGISADRYPDVVAYPERGIAWVATREPQLPPPPGADPGIIARFELPS